MNLSLSDFLTRRKVKLRIAPPQNLEVFSKKAKTSNWEIIRDGNSYLVRYQQQDKKVEQSIDVFLLQTLAPKENIQKVHQAIADYYSTPLSFKDGLPIYLIRRHGSRAGAEGREMRRRGWIVKFDNAYIVYADNFFSRHMFEYAYFVSNVSYKDVQVLINSFEMPFSSGGGTEEKLHRAFPALNHLTATSQLYLSHIYDLNKGNYNIDSMPFEAGLFLERGRTARFGCGYIEDWNCGEVIKNGANCRIMNEVLPKETLEFLKAYNIRTLSPLNYFPFPKSSVLTDGSINGEDEGLREFIISFYRNIFGDVFSSFRDVARVYLEQK